MKLTIETKQTEQVEIPVPSFMRSKDEKHWVGILDEKTIVTIYANEDFVIVKNSTPEIAERELTEAHKTFHSCTEFEFLQKYDEVIESISLHPKLAV